MAVPTIIERAFQLARTGEYHGWEGISKQLKAERYERVNTHLESPLLRRQIRAECQHAIGSGSNSAG